MFKYISLFYCEFTICIYIFFLSIQFHNISEYEKEIEGENEEKEEAEGLFTKCFFFLWNNVLIVMGDLIWLFL